MKTLVCPFPYPPVWAPKLNDGLLTALAVTLELAVMLGFFGYSLSCGDWSWFPRGGAVITAVAALDVFWRGRHSRLQPFSVVVGTGVWGFGDLLGG